MDYENKKWIRLGNVDFPVHYLITVSEEEAVDLLSSKHIHSDRVRNAWKQANNFKSPNRKKKGKK